MGALFSKKKTYWVPEHRKMGDKLEDLSKWKVVEDMTGWQIQNSASKIGEAMAQSKATAEVNLSFNGLGDDECEAIAVAIKTTRTIKRIILSNNHIHETGAEVRSSLAFLPPCFCHAAAVFHPCTTIALPIALQCTHGSVPPPPIPILTSSIVGLRHPA